MSDTVKCHQRSDIESRIIRAPNGHLDSILKRLKVIAAKDASVLFIGPTGTGKELLADYLFEQTPKDGLYKEIYQKVNCIGFPETMIDSELFGHKKGAFTGATSDHIGLIEASNGGTLFLDEIGVLPNSSQAKLLRVLEEKKVRKLGENKWKEVNVRFIAATNRKDLNIDLKHRFDFLIEILPLNKRREDIPYLLTHFLEGSPFKSINLKSLFQFSVQDWEGNVRDFRRALRDTEVDLEVAMTTGDISQDDPDAFVFKPYVSKEVYQIYTNFVQNTNFSDLILQDFPAVTSYQKMFRYEGHQAIVPGELHLIFDKQFPEIATKLVKRYAPFISKENNEILNALIWNPDDKIIHRWDGQVLWLQDAYFLWKTGREKGSEYPIFLDEEKPFSGYPQIKLTVTPLDSELEEKKIERPVDLYDLPWKESKGEFPKKYYNEAKKRNPELTDRELAKKIGVSRQTISKWKAEFTQ